MQRSMIWLAVSAAGCVPASAVFAAVAEPSAAAQQNYARLETVIVSAPLHKSAAETALPVTVIDGAALRERAGKSIGATLDASPGLASASFGPGVGQPVIRGQAGPRVKVLQNGLSSADASAVSADHAVAVEPMLADAVEVLRGPATLLYGGGAIGGVVNVIDNQIPRALPADRLRGAVEQRHDSASDGDTSVLRLDGAAGQLAWHLDGVYRDWNATDIPGLAFNRDTVADIDESADGFIANSDGRNHRVAGGLSWFFDDGYIGVGVSDMRNKYGIPAGAHVHLEDAAHEGEEEHADDEHEADEEEAIRIDMQQTRYDIAGEWTPAAMLLNTLRWRVAYTDYEHSELEGGIKATTFTNETWDGRLELVHEPIAGWHGVLGLQLRDTEFAALGEEAFIPRSDTRAAGLFLVEDHHRGDWIYELGLRADRDVIDADGQDEEGFNAYSASASALWNFMPRWSLGLALSTSQRAPTVEELYSNVDNVERHDDHFHYHDPVMHAATRAIEVGNAELDRETSRNLDLTLRYSAGPLTGYITGFYNDFRDYIYLGNTGLALGEVPVMAYQQQDATFHGVEFELNVPLGRTPLGTLGLDLFGDSTRGELDGGDAVPRLPPRRLGTRLNLARDGFTAYASVLRAAAQDRPGANETDSDGYTRVDAGVSYALALVDEREALLFLRGTNLTDRTIRASTSFLRDYAPEPGRSLEAGVRLSF